MSLCYLINQKSRECFYLGPGNWAALFPDSEQGFSAKFKFSDIFPQRRLVKSGYVGFLDGLVRSDGITFSYGDFDTGQIVRAAQAWAKDHDIIFSRSFYAEDRFVLTGSSNPEDGLGLLSHYMKKIMRALRSLSTYIFWLRLGQFNMLRIKARTANTITVKAIEMKE